MKSNTIQNKPTILQFMLAMSAFGTMLLVGAFISRSTIINTATSPAAALYPDVYDACAELKDNKIINVTFFGATGNDESDDTQALREAIACAVEKYNETGEKNGRAATAVYFPRGTYHLSDTLQFVTDASYRYGGGVKIFGAGSDRTTIVAHHSEDVFDVALSADAPLIRYLVEFKRMTIRSAGQGGKAIAIRGVYANASDRNVEAKLSGIVIDKVRDNNYFTYGVWLSKLMTPTVHKVIVEGLRNTAVDNNGDTPLVLSDYKTHSCVHAEDSYGVGVMNLTCSGAMRGASLVRAGEGEMVTHSQISDVNVGILVSVDPYNPTGPSVMDGKITYNKIYAYRRGIQVQDKSWVSITSNTLDPLSVDTKYEDITLYGNRQGSIVSNIFKGKGTNRVNLFLSGKIGQVVYDNRENIIAQNKFAEAKNAIILGKGTSDTVIQNNTFTNITRKLWDFSSESQGPIDL